MSTESLRRLLLATAIASGAVLTVAVPGTAAAAPAVTATVVANHDDDDDDDDDGGSAPRGGVEAGHGGAAGGADPGLPFALAGAAALARGGVFLVRRLSGEGR